LAILLLAVTSAKADSYDLYIVAGQSNTVGLSANLSELTAAEQLQTDVDFRYWTHRDVDLTTGPLRLQSSSLGGGGNSYGPEMTLARALADEAALSGRRVMIIKSAFGGTSLDLASADSPCCSVATSHLHSNEPALTSAFARYLHRVILFM
jgi:hypothetical protein